MMEKPKFKLRPRNSKGGLTVQIDRLPLVAASLPSPDRPVPPILNNSSIAEEPPTVQQVEKPSLPPRPNSFNLAAVKRPFVEQQQQQEDNDEDLLAPSSSFYAKKQPNEFSCFKEEDVIFQDLEEEPLVMHQPSLLVSPTHENMSFTFPPAAADKEEESDNEDDDVIPPPPPLLDDFEDDEDFDFAAFGNQLQPQKLPPAPPPRRTRNLAQKKDFATCAHLAETRERENNWPVVVFDCRAAREVVFKYADSEPDIEDLLMEHTSKLLCQVSETGKFVLMVLAALDFQELVKTREMFLRLLRVGGPLQRVRKMCQRVWIVRPVSLCSSLLFTLRHVISPKFWRKLYFFRNLQEVNQLVLLPISLPVAEEEEGVVTTYQVGRNFYNHWQCSLAFGVPLHQLCAKSPFGIPSFLHRSISFLLYHGMKTPGLFRIGADQDLVMQCKQNLNAGQDIDLGGYWSSSQTSVKPESIHVCAYLLKTLFRELPEPVIPRAAYERIVQLSNESGPDTDLLAYVLSKTLPKILPQVNLATVRYLAYFLHHCSQQEHVTMMNAENLAKIWNINLFRFDSDHQVELANLPQTIRATLVMITNAPTVFPITADSVLPICYSPLTAAKLQVIIWDESDREYDALIQQQQPAAVAYESLVELSTITDIGEVESLSNRELKQLLKLHGVLIIPLERNECVKIAKTKVMEASLQHQEQQSRSSSPTKTSRAVKLRLLHQVSQSESEAVEDFLSTMNPSELVKDASLLKVCHKKQGAPTRVDPTLVLEALNNLPLFGERSTNRAILSSRSTWTLRDLDSYTSEELQLIVSTQATSSTVDLKSQARQALTNALFAGGMAKALFL